MWTVVKNGVIGCKICEKKGVIIQADDIGRHMGVPPGFLRKPRWCGYSFTRPEMTYPTRVHNTQKLPGLVKTYGDVPPKWFSFLQETRAPFFLEKVPNNGSDFQIFQGSHGKFENLVCFWGKIARNGYFFRKNPYIWLPIFGKIAHGHGHGCWVAGDMSPTKQNLTELRGGGGMTRLNYVDKYGAPAGPEQNFKSFKKNVILL